MSYKWKQVQKYLDIGDKKYHRSYEQNYIIEKNDDFSHTYK